MTNLLDERIDYQAWIESIGAEWVRTLFQGAEHQSIANTIVQLIGNRASGWMASAHPNDFRNEGAARFVPLAKYLEERKAKTWRKRPGNLTRNTDA